MPSQIHATALIDAQAQLAEDVQIGPYAIVEAGAQLGAGCVVEAQAQILANTVIGPRCRIGRASIIGGEPQTRGFDSKIPSRVVLGAENILREHVTIHRSMMAEQETRIGDRNFLMTGCHLAHDVVVENDCTLANAALVAGHVHIASFCFLGGNCALHQFIRVGRGAIVKGVVGVSVDIPPFCVVAEMNALAGLNIIGLRRQGFTPEQRNALKRAFSLIFRSGKNLTQSIEEAQNQPWEGPAALLVEFVATRGKRGIATLNRQISSEHS